MNFFNLPHIIVVFHPGSSGNFISGLINKVISQDFTNIKVSKNGDASFLNNDPMFSFGRHSFEDYRFKNQDEKIEYYINYISKANRLQRMVLLTHNFSNIPLYQKYYPNAKIIVITLESIKEKIISVLFQVEKTKFDKDWNHNWEHTTFELIKQRWEKYWFVELMKIFDDKKAVIDIILNKMSDNNRPIMFYLTLQYYFKKFNLSQFNNEDLLNFNFEYTLIDGKIERQIGLPIEQFLNSHHILLPFKDILYNNKNKLIDVISKSLGYSLSTEEEEFISNQLSSFLNNQNKSIIEDPFLFCEQVQKEFHKLTNYTNIF